MANETKMIAFGPVPSRRLGQSLGINNIPAKICTYSCIYCQVGRTLQMQIDRKQFYNREDILKDVEWKVKEAMARGEPIDYLTFVPDGEPTLDINLGKEIELLKGLGIKIAVISNASLLWNKDVRDDLNKSDWVSLKIDAVNEAIWRKIDRAHGLLRLEKILWGIKEFSRSYQGKLVTETMLVRDFNDTVPELGRVADFIAEIEPEKSYLSIPIRPPSESWVRPAGEYTVIMAYQVFSERSIDVEYLIGYEGNAFAFTGNVEEDLLSITSVHPMREDAVSELLSKAKAGWDAVENLITQDKLVELKYMEKKFYMRKFPHLKTSNRDRQV
jgi:wyosine [tRNA(Phe)-imidazoG37] synthetase (radical SAM superfamily)